LDFQLEFYIRSLCDWYRPYEDCSSAQEEDAAKRAEEVEGQGFENVKILDEGPKAWRKAGYRVENNG
jgi:hypothetical protein